jgi:hypothetical protein
MVFVRRYNQDPTLEQLLEIEAVNVVDLAPPAPSTGVGTGAVLVVGQFEDGPYAAGGDSLGAVPYNTQVQEVVGPQDFAQKFGSFGFVRGGTPSQDPVARRGGGELWNGNGYLKLKGLRSRRLMIARVDDSVGQVQLTPLACVTGTSRGPFDLTAGDTMTATPGGATTALAAAAAVLTASGAPTGMNAGDALRITVDGNAPVLVSFLGTESVIATIVSRINAVLGSTIASNSSGNLRLTGLILGLSGRIVIEEVTTGTLTRLGGFAALSAAGTGNVGNIDAVTAAELVAIFNGTAGWGSAGVSARVTEDGFVRVCEDSGTIQITAGAIQAALGLPTTSAAATDHDGGTLPAGARVTDGVTTWVTTQAVSFAEASAAAVAVKVRPALDDGTALGGAALAVDTLTDQPSFTDLGCSNPIALTVALTDAQMDIRYEAAMDATLAYARNPAREADYMVSARRTAVTMAAGLDNQRQAREGGLTSRKFIGRAALGVSPDTARTDVASYRDDGLFYTYPGWKLRVPEIAIRGSAGGLGFTDDGVITVGGDTPLATLCARLNPEENPAQATDLIDAFFEVENVGRDLTIADYKLFKAVGICAPIVDPDDGPQYQSGVTSSLTSGRTTIARRKMADFIQDSMARVAKPYSKKLNRLTRREALTAAEDSFLSGLLSVNSPDLARIEDYRLDGVGGNTPERLALGVFVLLTQVRTLSSLDAITIRTEIGENTVISTS